MTDLFVSEDGTDIRICKKDEDGRERCICCVGLMGGYDDNEEPTEETLAEWRYYARLFAQAEKMKEALEQAETGFKMALSYTSPDQPKMRRQVAQDLGVVRKVLAGLKETNDDRQ